MIIIYPTETCYGVGCKTSDIESIDKIIKTKGREPEKGFLVIVPNMRKWKDIALPNKVALTLAGDFWPGPLTLICPARNGNPGKSGALSGRGEVVPGRGGVIPGRGSWVPEKICQKDENGNLMIACRESSSEIAHALAQEYGPIISTSANFSGDENPYSLGEIPQKLRDIADIIIDMGELNGTKPSTIYDCINMKVVRRGPITEKDIKDSIRKTK
jgi:L-threonylcarbamoyladenylate synthase